MSKRTSASLKEPVSDPDLVGLCDERVVVATLLPPPDLANPFAHLLDVVEWPALVRARRRTAFASLLSCPLPLTPLGHVSRSSESESQDSSSPSATSPRSKRL